MTSHALVLIEVARTPDSTVRELAARAGLTERQAHRILADLVDSGYVERDRIGRRNRYRIDQGKPLRHPSMREHRVGELLEVLGE